MPALRGARDQRTEDSTSSGAIVGHVDRAGVYLTNEVFLYRVVGLVASDGDDLVEIEDCYGLDVVSVPLRDLRSRRLRVVTPDGC